MGRVEHHLHKSEKDTVILDRVCMVAAVLMPLTTLPQIYRIWVTQIVDGISILFWVLYTVLCIPMLLYGIVHKAKPIILLNVLWIIVNLIIIAGVITFG